MRLIPISCSPIALVNLKPTGRIRYAGILWRTVSGNGGLYFNPDTISDRDFEWLGRDFYAISFEKGHAIRKDHQNLFDNPKYQEKLSARRMLEIAQEEATEGYVEVWD